MRRALPCSVLLLLVCPLSLAANDLKEIERRLKSDYEGKIVTLRKFHGGDSLRFSEDGQLLKGGEIGAWTLNGRIEIKDIDVTAEKLDIYGHRVFVVYKKEGKQLVHSRNRDRFHLEIIFDSAVQDAGRINRALTAVLVSKNDQLADLVPPYWRDFLSNAKPVVPGPQDVGSVQRDQVFRVGGTVSPFKCIFCPKPSYTATARKAKLEGSLLLWAVVNEHGTLVRLRVVRPLGLGLEESAVTTVNQWVFEPARRFGKPVAVEFNLEIAFDLN